MNNEFLQSVRKEFDHYRSIGAKAIDQLNEEELFWQYNTTTNSIAIIVHHLWGNMKSRWTDFLTADGEKTWRNRDAEFEDILKAKVEVTQKWNEGWACLFDALDTLHEGTFATKVYIRNQEHSITEAIHRQLTHYAYHVGQIVFIAKLLRGEAWNALTIAKGGSDAFNEEKFARGKHSGHFSDDLHDPS